jgi:hypothetical protein
MSIIFPTGPTANVTTYTLGTRTWIWTGQAWKIVATTITGPTGPTGSSITGPTGPTGAGSTVADIYLKSMFYA